MSKRILVNGACGKMGQELIKTIVKNTKHKLVAACDLINIGKDILSLLGLTGAEVLIHNSLLETIKVTKPNLIIDFTSPSVIRDNIEIVLTEKINMIVGTTGITEIDLINIAKLAKANKVNIIIAPNFALGAVLMMQLSAEIAKYLKDVEIIELHHHQKIDAPSGTAIKTADLINKVWSQETKEKRKKDIEKLESVRGGEKEGIKIHSVRLPGLVAHQEVIFGAEGQSLTIRHDSYNRASFMPGIRLAIEKIDKINGLIYGLENILD